MSVEIELRKVSLNPIDVSNLSKDWVDETGQGGRLAYEGPGCAYFFLPGRSIRGFSLTLHRKGLRNRVELCLNVCASHGDWECAFSFLRFGHERGFAVQSTEVELGDLSSEAATERAKEQFGSDIRALQQMLLSHPSLSLETRYFSVPVRRADIPEGQLDSGIVERIHDEILQRATKYEAARAASLITAGSGDTLIVWAGEASLAPAADYVVLSPIIFDPEKSAIMPFKDLLEKLPAGIEKIREKPPLYYFEALPLESSQWIELNRMGAPFGQPQFKRE